MNHSVIRHCRAAASSFVIAAAAAAAADPATNAPVVRRVQLGLTRAIQLHSRDDAVSGLRLGLLGCESRGIDGLSVCLGGNVSTADSSGLLLAGLGNGVDGTHRGVMLSLGVNYARALDGVSLSLLFGGHVEAVRGVQMGGLCSMNSTLSGVAASAVNLATYRQDGIVLGLANAAFDQQNGVAVGLANWAGRKAAGVQAGAFNQAVDGMDGLQLGLFNTAGELRGVQFGALNVQIGALNGTRAPDSAGAQIGLVNAGRGDLFQAGPLNVGNGRSVQAGLLNWSDDHRAGAALQVGAVNVLRHADWGTHVQIGALNLACNGRAGQFGLVNVANDAPLQIGLINFARGDSAQIGVVNWAEEGLQIGALNANDRACIPVFPIVNFGMKW